MFDFNYKYSKLPAKNTRAKILKFLNANAFGQSVPQSGTKNIARGVFLKGCWQIKNILRLFCFFPTKKRVARR